ncbi:hypothetical protein Tco_0090535 [Tanacetum coccineum]
MDKAKVVSSPLTPNFKLTDKDCPSSKKNIEKMDRVPYASAVGSLMYAMTLDLAGNKDNMESTSGYLMTFTGGAVSMASRLQSVWPCLQTEGASIWQVQKRAKNYCGVEKFFARTRCLFEDGMFELNKVHTDDNASDMLTKVVAREKLKIRCSFTGMANSSL